MSEECTHDCSTCTSKCEEESFTVPLNDFSDVKKVIGVVSGKGGVGKSLVSALLAVEMQRRDHKVAIMDADLTGPSIPRMFGLKGPTEPTAMGLTPAESKFGIKVMSINLLLEDETAPVVWRGPVIAGTVTQFWSDVHWGEVDYMFVDMPPGTGDVPLTIFQSLPVSGIVIVASPQDLVGMIVEKAVNMANMMGIPILGIVENMSYLTCPDCGKKISIFGGSGVQPIADKYGIPVLAQIPMDPQFSRLSDKGMIELFEGDYMEKAAEAIE